MTFKNTTSFVLVFIFSFFSCYANQQDLKKMSINILNSFSKDIKETHGFKSFGTGSGGPTLLSSLSIFFNANKKQSLDQSRSLILELVQKLINKTNSTREIRPYLAVFPFTEKNIEIVISFKDSEQKNVLKPYISLITYVQGKIIYSCTDEKKPNEYETFLTETYDEAMHIVQGQHNTN